MDETQYTEIKPEVVYLTIPTKWVCVYHKLLSYLADFGKMMIDDCNAGCRGSGKNIITCWNLFQSAIASHAVGEDKQAEFFIDYIKKQLNFIYRGTDKYIYHKNAPIAITPDGKLKAMLSCEDETKFFVDVKTGELYQQWLDSEEEDIRCVKSTYEIEREKLKVEDTETGD